LEFGIGVIDITSVITSYSIKVAVPARAGAEAVAVRTNAEMRAVGRRFTEKVYGNARGDGGSLALVGSDVAGELRLADRALAKAHRPPSVLNVNRCAWATQSEKQDEKNESAAEPSISQVVDTGVRGVLLDAGHYERMGSAIWLYS
jgi:hypothetical protein